MKKTCDAVRESLSAWLDGRVAPQERVLLEEHLAACEACRRERDALERTRALVASAGRLAAPESWKREAVAEARRREAAPGARARLIARPWALSSLAAAAVVALVLVAVRVALFQSGPAAPGGRVDSVQPVPISTRPAAPPASAQPPVPREPGPAGGVAPTGSAAAPQKAARLAGRGRGPREAFDLVAPLEDKGKKKAAPAVTLAVPESEAPAPIAAGAPQPAVEGAAIDERPPEILRVTLAQIRFPEPGRDGVAGATGDAHEVRRSFASEAAKPPAEAPSPAEPRMDAAAAAPRIVRVRVLLDPETNRILEVLDPAPAGDHQAASLVARLRGATVATIAEPPAEEEPPRAALRAQRGTAPIVLQASVPAPAREVILEIVIEPAAAP